MEKKTLLIVYKEKDEEIFNHLKDLIESNDDGEGVVGTEDGTIRVFKCSEENWLKHKESGHADMLAQKILFIDDITDVVLENPIYDQYGVSYGPIDDKYYAIIIDEKYAWEEEAYKSFQEELKQITDNEIAEVDVFAKKQETKENIKKKSKFIALGVLFPPALIVAGGKALSTSIKDNKELRKQMLYYAICKVYREELDSFMKK